MRTAVLSVPGCLNAPLVRQRAAVQLGEVIADANLLVSTAAAARACRRERKNRISTTGDRRSAMPEDEPREWDREAFTDAVAAYQQSLGRDFWRLLWVAAAELATATSVRPERLAALADLPLERTLAVAREAWEWAPSGERLVGAGLTSVETPYRVDIDEHTKWTYCAPDTLELPVILDRPVRTRSSCAATGEAIRVHATATGVQDLDPPGAVSLPDMSVRTGLAEVGASVCNHSRFYRDAEAGSEWLAANPRGRLLTVSEAFAVMRASMVRIRDWCQEPVGRRTDPA
ncbi:MAG: organomercurial lyase [Nocardiopsaceae bacterium]|nr:organomercurial lyase [Nocardiopsaceae bacterium]